MEDFTLTRYPYLQLIQWCCAFHMTQGQDYEVDQSCLGRCTTWICKSQVPLNTQYSLIVLTSPVGNKWGITSWANTGTLIEHHRKNRVVVTLVQVNKQLYIPNLAHSIFTQFYFLLISISAHFKSCSVQFFSVHFLLIPLSVHSNIYSQQFLTLVIIF